MGIIRKALRNAFIGGAATAGAFYYWTRDSKFIPFPRDDPILTSAAYHKHNPNKNPNMEDLCIRKVPLSKIKPELLRKDGKLVEAFCAGVFGGLGYEPQRLLMSFLHQNLSTTHQLWSRKSLQSSSYEAGVQITNHFEVLEHTWDHILVRAGDSPLKKDLREADGLFELTATVKDQEGIVEFGMKSVFFQSLGKTNKPPVPAPAVWLHQQYTKLLMEIAVGEIVQ